MADISAKDVMALRNRTGLPMMSCKKALKEVGGDIEAAEEHLRKTLKGKMETRTERAAAEGRVAVAVNDGAASIVELRCETDFTAKNDKFIEAADKIAHLALEQDAGDIEATDEMKAIIDDIRISTGENASIARIHKTARDAGESFGTYVHHDGKTGVLIHATTGVGEDVLRQICMHITAAVPRPIGITPDDIPEELVEKERKFRMEQAIEAGKNEEIAAKMVEGGIKKFFSDVALLEQDFVVDPSKKIKDLLGGAAIKEFFRWEVGVEA
ncbi:MAG TPA: translation elongation factor Ts [Phycisphaerales bacterium]|nr:translation elongation factor Ts [Phycisphaerales bacterium]